MDNVAGPRYTPLSMCGRRASARIAGMFIEGIAAMVEDHAKVGIGDRLRRGVANLHFDHTFSPVRRGFGVVWTLNSTRPGATAAAAGVAGAGW